MIQNLRHFAQKNYVPYALFKDQFKKKKKHKLTVLEDRGMTLYANLMRGTSLQTKIKTFSQNPFFCRSLGISLSTGRNAGRGKVAYS